MGCDAFELLRCSCLEAPVDMVATCGFIIRRATTAAVFEVISTEFLRELSEHARERVGWVFELLFYKI